MQQGREAVSELSKELAPLVDDAGEIKSIGLGPSNVRDHGQE